MHMQANYVIINLCTYNIIIIATNEFHGIGDSAAGKVMHNLPVHAMCEFNCNLYLKDTLILLLRMYEVIIITITLIVVYDSTNG